MDPSIIYWPDSIKLIVSIPASPSYFFSTNSFLVKILSVAIKTEVIQKKIFAGHIIYFECNPQKCMMHTSRFCPPFVSSPFINSTHGTIGLPPTISSLLAFHLRKEFVGRFEYTLYLLNFRIITDIYLLIDLRAVSTSKCTIRPVICNKLALCNRQQQAYNLVSSCPFGINHFK